MSTDNLAIVIAHKCCPICGSISEDVILMNQKLTENEAEKVKDLDGEIIGASENACKECSKYKDSVVFCIAIDEEKSTKEMLHRTGQITGVVKDFALFKEHPEFIQTTKNGVQYCFISEAAGIKMGMFNK